MITYLGVVITHRGDNVVRTQIQLSEDEAAAVKRLARERSVSMAAVIRAAVDQYVSRESGVSIDERWRRSLAALGGFHSGRSDLSQTHDDEFAAAASE
jgi:predicted transcriptional regulator